jgi:hypothetical protein
MKENILEEVKFQINIRFHIYFLKKLVHRILKIWEIMCQETDN